MDENLQSLSNSELEERLHVVDDRRLWVVSEALRRGISPDKIHEITKIDLWFLDKLLSIIQVEKACATQPIDRDLLLKAKNIRIP